MVLQDSDGYTCDSSIRIDGGIYDGEFKQYVKLYTCSKCGIVKAIYEN